MVVVGRGGGGGGIGGVCKSPLKCLPDRFSLLSGTMLHMTAASMCGMCVTLCNLLTVTDAMFSHGYITAGTDVILHSLLAQARCAGANSTAGGCLLPGD